jgi:hypothetical protein
VFRRLLEALSIRTGQFNPENKAPADLARGRAAMTLRNMMTVKMMSKYLRLSIAWEDFRFNVVNVTDIFAIWLTTAHDDWEIHDLRMMMNYVCNHLVYPVWSNLYDRNGGTSVFGLIRDSNMDAPSQLLTMLEQIEAISGGAANNTQPTITNPLIPDTEIVYRSIAQWAKRMFNYFATMANGYMPAGVFTDSHAGPHGIDSRKRYFVTSDDSSLLFRTSQTMMLYPTELDASDERYYSKQIDLQRLSRSWPNSLCHDKVKAARINSVRLIVDEIVEAEDSIQSYVSSFASGMRGLSLHPFLEFAASDGFYRDRKPLIVTMGDFSSMVLSTEFDKSSFTPIDPSEIRQALNFKLALDELMRAAVRTVRAFQLAENYYPYVNEVFRNRERLSHIKKFVNYSNAATDDIIKIVETSGSWKKFLTIATLVQYDAANRDLIYDECFATIAAVLSNKSTAPMLGFDEYFCYKPLNKWHLNYKDRDDKIKMTFKYTNVGHTSFSVNSLTGQVTFWTGYADTPKDLSVLDYNAAYNIIRNGSEVTDSFGVPFIITPGVFQRLSQTQDSPALLQNNVIVKVLSPLTHSLDGSVDTSDAYDLQSVMEKDIGPTLVCTDLWDRHVQAWYVESLADSSALSPLRRDFMVIARDDELGYFFNGEALNDDDLTSTFRKDLTPVFAPGLDSNRGVGCYFGSFDVIENAHGSNKTSRFGALAADAVKIYTSEEIRELFTGTIRIFKINCRDKASHINLSEAERLV